MKILNMNLSSFLEPSEHLPALETWDDTHIILSPAPPAQPPVNTQTKAKTKTKLFYFSSTT